MKLLGAVLFAMIPVLAGAQTGPETETRFPPLKLPPGFEATLFACDPLVEYPSVIALGPGPNTLFVAYDYMTGLGREIVRRDEVRLVTDTDGDGYADTSTLYADGFNSIEGLEFFDGDVFVMHSPFLTKLRDHDNDGVADEREDLLTGLGLPPEENDVRLHCANGVTAGFDNWLYLSMGDHGVNMQRPEGDRLVLNGGGILRCRRDGSDLHIFATGTRNIYDVALDANLNVFIRDNENDGGSFKIRVSHSFFGADHGYPYLFRERPDELLTPLADLGLGSSAGGVCYLETAFPAEYRGNLFFAEWGKSIVRYPLTSQGSSFAPTEEHEFAAGDEADTYPFKPTDVVVDRDGSLLISDWADGQRPKRGRARIYRIRHTDAEPTSKTPQQLPRRLDSPSAHVRVAAQLEIAKSDAEIDFDKLGVRGRVHAVWLMADDAEKLLVVAKNDTEPAVRLQAVRALGDLGQVAGLAEVGRMETDAGVLRAIMIALGRAHWDGLADWIQSTISEPDFALAHAAKQMLRHSEGHAAVLSLLDLESGEPARRIALQALADWVDADIAKGLIFRLETESDPGRQRELADLLTRIHRKSGPWVYWEYKPLPRTPNSVLWFRTLDIGEALNEFLAKADFNTRVFVLGRMRRERIDVSLPVLADWLRQDKDEDRLTTILHSIAAAPTDRSEPILEEIVRDTRAAEKTRLLALNLWLGEAPNSMFKPPQDPDSYDKPTLALRELMKDLPDDGILASVLRQLHKRRGSSPLDGEFVTAKLRSNHPGVRAAALEWVFTGNLDAAREQIRPLLSDPDPNVREVAATLGASFGISEAAQQLLAFTDESNARRRSAGLLGLRDLADERAVPIALRFLDDPETQLAAVRTLGALGNFEHAEVLIRATTGSQNRDVTPAVDGALLNWFKRNPNNANLRRQIAEFQGQTGRLEIWSFHYTPDLDDARAWARNPAQLVESGTAGSCFESGPSKTKDEGRLWGGVSEVFVDEPTTVQFLGAVQEKLELWLNGKRIYIREEPAEFRADSDRVDARLAKGLNQVCVITNGLFGMRFRRGSSDSEKEQLTQYALSKTGNPELGRELFFDVEVTQCALCHRINGEGGRIGPDLSGAGNRFSQIYLIESILEPSRALAPSFHSHHITLNEGNAVFGAKVAEDAESITIGDAAGQLHQILKAQIRRHEEQQVSIMPPGLEKRMTPRQFTDLLAFLLEQK